METPFTTDQFFGVFERYNSAVFPSQIIIIILGFLGLFLLHTGYSRKNKFIGIFLGFLWLWTGIVYHIAFFSEINPIANVFGVVFILQAGLLLYTSLMKENLHFSGHFRLKDFLGYFFILFGLMIYPLIGYVLEGSYLRIISLGLPCPTTILTFGYFMITQKEFPKYLLIIPSLWAVVGISAAVNFGVYQDFLMIVAAITANVFLLKKDKKH